MEPLKLSNGIVILCFNYDGSGAALAKEDGTFVRLEGNQLERALFPPREIQISEGRGRIRVRPAVVPTLHDARREEFADWCVNIRPRRLKQSTADAYLGSLKFIAIHLDLYDDDFFEYDSVLMTWVAEELATNQGFLLRPVKKRGDLNSALSAYREFVRYLEGRNNRRSRSRTA